MSGTWQARDQEVRILQACRNEMESYILDMRGAPNRKHGDSIDRNALSAVLDEYENWLWDNGETATQQEMQDKVGTRPSKYHPYTHIICNMSTGLGSSLHCVGLWRERLCLRSQRKTVHEHRRGKVGCAVRTSQPQRQIE